jgi:CDP-6-deoxy-D-xylo-4-hexulose-3-dehydrase
LEESGIQTRMLFAGNILRHPAFSNLKENLDYRVVGGLATTDQIMSHTFWVGVFPGLSEQQLRWISQKIGEAVQRKEA